MRKRGVPLRCCAEKLLVPCYVSRGHCALVGATGVSLRDDICRGRSRAFRVFVEGSPVPERGEGRLAGGGGAGHRRRPRPHCVTKPAASVSRRGFLWSLTLHSWINGDVLSGQRRPSASLGQVLPLSIVTEYEHQLAGLELPAQRQPGPTPPTPHPHLHNSYTRLTHKGR